MSLRLWIALFGIAMYLMVVFLLGDKHRTSYNLKHRLELIEKSNALDLENETLTKSFSERVLRPAGTKLVRFVSTILPLSEKSLSALAEKLRQAGIKKTAREYLAANCIRCVLITVCVFALLKFVGGINGSSIVMMTFVVLFAVYTFSRFHLGQMITTRRNRIEEDMPEVLDLLSVSVSAGLGFDQALQYVIDRCDGPLIEEFAITQREIALGKGRGEALKRMSDRCNVESFKMFVSAIVQAEVLGISISNVLQTQADNIRQMHKQRKEEKAAKLPVKILIPLIFLIFPVMFIVLMGPAAMKIIEAFM